MMKKYFYPFLLLFCSYTPQLVAQSAALDTLIAVLRQESSLYYSDMDVYVIEREENTPWVLHEIDSLSSLQDMLKLSTDTNTALVYYASLALAKRSYAHLPELYQRLSDAYIEVSVHQGCFLNPIPVADELYLYYQDILPKPLRHADSLLQRLDSLVLFGTRQVDDLLEKVLSNRVYTGVLKNRIVSLALDKEAPAALFYLVRNHRQEYAVQLKPILVRLWQEKDFHKLGFEKYYHTLDAVLAFDDDQVRSQITNHLEADDYSLAQKERLHALLRRYNVAIPTKL